jgi:hypothetical protein
VRKYWGEQRQRFQAFCATEDKWISWSVRWEVSAKKCNVWILLWWSSLFKSRRFQATHHGLINYIDTKAKCRHLNKIPVKGLRGRCLSEFIDWRYSQSCWYFRPGSWTVAPLTFSLVKTLLPLPPPSLCEQVYCMHVYSVSGYRGAV